MEGNKVKLGRRTKDEELKLIEVLDKYVQPELVAERMIDVIQNTPSDKTRLEAIKIYLNYRFGKPKEIKDITINKDLPIFNIDIEEVNE
jgi:hypothetical protein